MKLLLPLLAILLMGAVYAVDNDEAPQLLNSEPVEYRTLFATDQSPAGKIFEVGAKNIWQRTMIKLHKGEAIIIAYMYGKWSVNPDRKPHDAIGDPDTPVESDSYVMKIHNEGALCGKIGKDGKPFFIGNTMKIVAETDGELFLIANDDIKSEKGAGYSDNSGAIGIVIYEIDK